MSNFCRGMIKYKMKQFLLRKHSSTQNVYRYVTANTKFIEKFTWFNCIIASFRNSMAVHRKGMSSVCDYKYLFRESKIIRGGFHFSKTYGLLTRSYFFRLFDNAVVKRCRRERMIRTVFHCVRQTFLRPVRCTLTFAAAACNIQEGNTLSEVCSITDEELQELVTELDWIEELATKTLFCPECHKRLLVDHKQPNVLYCLCKGTSALSESHDGWIPFMEADDVIIWRKQYKKGQGMYAYKVYGRYEDVYAADFASIQVDCKYRPVWDAALAGVTVVETHANGVHDQHVLHWEVMWPRLFSNRDYVYIRRNKDFVVRSKQLPHKECLFLNEIPGETNSPPQEQMNASEELSQQNDNESASDVPRNDTHSRARRKNVNTENKFVDNRAFVILSKSCEHPKVPETKSAIRVNEYWSHMVVRTLNGPENPGMEFVLTYYDEPSVGTLPTGVSAWATGRAAPAYLARMRLAALEYKAWLNVPSDINESGEKLAVSDDLDNLKNDKATQTEVEINSSIRDSGEKVPERDSRIEPEIEKKSKELCIKDQQVSKVFDEEEDNGWWRYLYPFYYFI